MPVTWPQALAWRMRRQLIDPPGEASVVQVVHTLVALPAGAAADLAISSRRRQSGPDDVRRALAEGEVLTTFAFRGATHLMTPEHAAVHLALRASSRMWELPSWQTYYGLAPGDWPDFRAVVRDALDDGPLTREELGAAVTADRRFQHLAFAFADDAWTLLKPLAWQGDLSLGRPRDRAATFQRLDRNPRWPGLPDLDEAGRRAVQAYVRAYGPTTPRHVQYWLGEGLGAARKRIRSWIDDVELATVDVGGEPMLVLPHDVDELVATPPTDTVRLLPRYDQWVLGPGTADAHVVPPARRGAVSRGANLVVAGGVVAGTWTLAGDEVVVQGDVEHGPLAEGVDRLGAVLGRRLTL